MKLLNKPDTRRYAHAAIESGCTIKMEVDGVAYTFTPYEEPAEDPNSLEAVLWGKKR